MITTTPQKSSLIEKIILPGVIEHEYGIGVLASLGGKVRKRRPLLSFDIADPDLDTPAHVKTAMVEAIRKRKDLMHYTRIRGLPDFVESVSEYYSSKFRIKTEPMGQVLATVGSGEALYIIFSAMTSKGDEYVLPNPTFSAYLSLIQLFGGVPRFVRSKPDFHLDVDAIRDAVTKKTKAIVLCTPNNPTGAVYTKQELAKVLELARENEVAVISDENYCQVTYDGNKHFTIGALQGAMDSTIIVNGLSKVFSMTGWRLGYVIARPELIDQFEKIAYEIRGSVNGAVQQAGAVALRTRDSYVKSVVRHYDRRRRLLVPLLREAGLVCHMPEGGFEAFPEVPDKFRRSGGSMEFTTFLAENAGVLVKPGKYFGPDGDKYFRMVYCRDEKIIEEGARRIARALKKVSA